MFRKKQGRHHKTADAPESVEVEPAVRRLDVMTKAQMALEIFYRHKGEVRYNRPYEAAYRGDITVPEADEQVIQLQIQDDANQAQLDREEGEQS